MKRSNRVIRTGFAIAALCLSGAAMATPFTYEFELPNWQIYTGLGSDPGPASAALFGTHAVIDITFDNGASNNLNQTYLNSQLVQLSLRSVGGTFSNTWTYSDTLVGLANPYNADQISYVSTDAAGVPTLNLRATTGDPNFEDFQNAAGAFQMAQLGASGNGYIPLDVSTYDPYYIAIYLPPNMEVGTVVSSVPEPGSLALTMAGLAALAFVRKRRQA